MIWGLIGFALLSTVSILATRAFHRRTGRVPRSMPKSQKHPTWRDYVLDELLMPVVFFFVALLIVLTLYLLEVPLGKF